MTNTETYICVHPCGSQLEPILYVVGLTAWFPLYRTCVHKLHSDEGIYSSSGNNMSLGPYCNVDTQLSALWKATSVAENLVGRRSGFLPQQYTSYGDTYLWSPLGKQRQDDHQDSVNVTAQNTLSPHKTKPNYHHHQQKWKSNTKLTLPSPFPQLLNYKTCLNISCSFQSPTEINIFCI